MACRKLGLILILSSLALSHLLNQRDISEISVAYFKAWEVKLVTVINCFGPGEYYKLVKGYLNNGFYVQIVTSFSEFNVSGRCKSGVVVNARCDQMLKTLIEHPQINSYMLTNIYWMFLESMPESQEKIYNGLIPTELKVKYEECFRFVDVLPTSRVVIGVLSEYWTLFDVYKPHWTGQLHFNKICIYNQDLTVLENMRHSLRFLDSQSKERRNLQGFAMPSATSITSPEFYSGLEDHSDTIHDLWAKANYPYIKALMYDLNFTLNLRQVDKGGFKTNGTFNGIMGLFQNRTIELGCLGLLMRTERMEALTYTIVTLHLKTSFIFKQPPLSLVSDIFELPFSGGVWLSCFGFVIVYWFSLVLARAITKTEPFTPLDSLTFMIGTLFQQTCDLLPEFNATKLLFFLAHLASFFIFTSYSASIVALLQSPSQSITSVADLAMSPLKAGSMDTVYAWVYFNESTDPDVQKLFRSKIKPLGKNAFTEPDVGMKRVRDELYAFQVQTNAAYRLIRETFSQEDTCKIYELEAIRLPPFAIPVVKGSKYRELFRLRLIWQREVGIIRRFNLIWIAEKPRCESGRTGFNSVGLNELRYAYIFMAVGFGIAISIVGAEIAWNRWRHWRTKKEKLVEKTGNFTENQSLEQNVHYLFLN